MTDYNVVAKLNLMPEGVKTDLGKIREKVIPLVNRVGKFHSSEIKPIAFGLSSLEVTILLDDSKGGTDKLEKEISNIPGVAEVTVIDVNRL
ncbi:MAG: elongation factor 1-beta [Candidatus Altiarchaeota archaeon]